MKNIIDKLIIDESSHYDAADPSVSVKDCIKNEISACQEDITEFKSKIANHNSVIKKAQDMVKDLDSKDEKNQTVISYINDSIIREQFCIIKHEAQIQAAQYIIDNLKQLA